VLTSLAAGAAAAALLTTAACTSQRTGSSGSSSSGGAVSIGLVTKTNSNPYFVTLRDAAQAEAKKHGARLIALAGKFDGDNQGQVDAINNLAAQHVKGILITPSSSKGVLGAIAAARSQGILVIALDTATEPASAVDATYATDNMAAGVSEGKYVRGRLGSAQPNLLMMDGTPGSSVDDERHNGFL
jgi:fructose transport system substrate-binding protein